MHSVKYSRVFENVESANVPLHHSDEVSLVLRDVQLFDSLSGVTIAPCVLIQLHAELLCGIVIHHISYLMVRFSIRHAIILFVTFSEFLGKRALLIYSLISPDAVLSKAAWQRESIFCSLT